MMGARETIMSEKRNRTAAWSYVLDEPLTILVADDDPILCEFAAVHLSTPTVTIVTAPDGVAALDQLRATPCDLALVDIEMPRFDGFELLQAIRFDAELNQLPVMMLTGHEDIASIDRAFRLGANAFTSKPVNWRLLSYQIRFMLHRCALERGVINGAELKSASARELVLGAGCEAILREASVFLESLPNRTGEAVECLERIAKLAGAALSEQRPSPPISGPAAATERIDAA